MDIVKQFNGNTASLRRLSFAFILITVMITPLIVPESLIAAGTSEGEIEERPAPVARRVCLGGDNIGNLCKENTDCPDSTCKDRNIYNLSVAVHYDAPAADLTAVENLISQGSAVIFDVTDGQAEIGQATIHNNAFGTNEADVRIYPATCTSGTSVGSACNGHNNCPPNTGASQGECGVWWWANTGSWMNRGSIHVSINNITGDANRGNKLAHEFTHLVFDARDEYQDSPGCLVSGASGTADCPHSGSGETECLMDSNSSELCWGQGDPTDFADISGGNHDATNTTEQSECRDNRSCWDQVVWSWPSSYVKPAGAPDPGAGGAVVNPTQFIHTSDTVRVVLVLDESGSMDLESPKRIERLKVAAKDFVALAENSTELGIVSYATDAETTSGRASVPINPLGANRSAYNTAINNLSPDTRTNISDGLLKAKTMITDAGGVTANTFVVLMTDGKNNEPQPQATADATLTAQVADLLASGIPVYVTCTGGDLGLQSQCAEIASGTGGFYVDSADAARLPEAFVGFHERITGNEAIESEEGYFSKISSFNPKPIYVDEGSESVTFTLLWHNAAANASMLAISPDGTSYQSIAMPQGRYVRVKDPKAGDWKISIDPRGTDESRFVVRGFTKNKSNSLVAAVRYPTVLPGEDIYVYAYPKNLGRSITSPDGKIVAKVTLPDGSIDTLELFDQGRNKNGKGDDLPGDGIFTGVYKNTARKGAYNFLMQADVDQWHLGNDAHDHNKNIISGRYNREVRLSATVGDPADVVTHPEDDPQISPDDPDQDKVCNPCELATILILALILLVLLVLIYVVWRCCCLGRSRG